MSRTVCSKMNFRTTCKYYLLSALIVALSSIVIDGVTSTSDANSVGVKTVFKDCTDGDLLQYADSNTDIYNLMTCEPIPGIPFTVPMVSRIHPANQRYTRIVQDTTNPIYDIVPMYHDSVGVHYKNTYILCDNFIPTPTVDKSTYFTLANQKPWIIFVSRYCFLHTVGQVKHKAYTELLNLLTTSDDCKPAFLPPRMTQSGNKTSHFYQNMYAQCLDSDNITSVRIAQNVCKLCFWLFNETVPACAIWTESKDVSLNKSELYTNVVLHVSGVEEAADPYGYQKWIRRGHYLKRCDDGYLGHQEDCFQPVEYIDGVVSEIWIKHNIPDELASREAIISQVSEFILGTTDKVVLRFVGDAKSSEKYHDNCVSLKIVLITTVYVHVDELRDVVNSVKILLDQGKVGITYHNTSYVVYINTNHVQCLRTGNGETNTLTMTEGNMNLYILLGVVIFATFALVLLGLGWKFIKTRMILGNT